MTRHQTARHIRARRRTWSISKVSLIVVLCALALSWAGWLVAGGGLFWVGSPSMGTTAPVGSLVATQHLSTGQALHVGQIVVFQPRPGAGTIIHRIYRKLPGGRYMTKGDLNPTPDIWTITRAQVIGTPQVIIPAVGWIYKFSAWLFLGLAAVLITLRATRGPVHVWAAILAPILLIAAPFYRFRILVNGYIYGTTHVGRHVTVRLVSTGVIPGLFALPPSGARRAVAGQEVILRGAVPKHHVQGLITEAATLPWWGWGFVGLFCLLVPLALKQAVAPDLGSTHTQAPDGRRRIPSHARGGVVRRLWPAPWAGLGARALHGRQRRLA